MGREINGDPVKSILLVSFSATGNREERLRELGWRSEALFFKIGNILVHDHALGENPVQEEHE